MSDRLKLSGKMIEIPMNESDRQPIRWVGKKPDTQKIIDDVAEQEKIIDEMLAIDQYHGDVLRQVSERLFDIKLRLIQIKQLEES